MGRPPFDERELTVLFSALLLAAGTAYFRREVRRVPEWRFLLAGVGCLIVGSTATPDGGQIQIELTVEAGQAVLSVRDFGSGMSQAVQSRLFTPFFTTKGAHGSGLGLHVVQSVVEEQHGEISVESAPERGSTFRLRLAAARQQGHQLTVSRWL